MWQDPSCTTGPYQGSAPNNEGLSRLASTVSEM